MSDPLWRTGRWSDEHVEIFIGNLLRWGVVLAAIVTVAGGGVFLVQHGSTLADYRVFRSEPESLRSVTAVMEGAIHGHPTSIIQLGLLLLIATPITRVALSLVAFLKQHDRTYVVVTTLVLALLLYSLTGAGA